MLNELKSRLEDASTDNKVKVLILGHTGSVFSAGHDLKELVIFFWLSYPYLFYIISTYYFLCKNFEKNDTELSKSKSSWLQSVF